MSDELWTCPGLKDDIDEVLHQFASVEYQRSLWLPPVDLSIIPPLIDSPMEMYSTLYDDFHFEQFASEAARHGETKYLKIHELIDGYFDADESDFDPVAILNDPPWIRTVTAIGSALNAE